MAIRKRRRAATSPIDKALAKSDAEFVKDYLEPACVFLLSFLLFIGLSVLKPADRIECLAWLRGHQSGHILRLDKSSAYSSRGQLSWVKKTSRPATG